MDTLDFVKTVNKLRLDNKNKWYYWNGVVNGKDVKLKGYGTWIQIFKINNWDCSNAMEQKVGDFKKHLEWAANNTPDHKYIKSN